MRTTPRTDRELAGAFVVLCLALVVLFGVMGLALRVFLWLAGIGA